MKNSSMKAFILAALFGLALGMAGCASAPRCERPAPAAADEQRAPQEAIGAAPAPGGDDMERLD